MTKVPVCITIDPDQLAAVDRLAAECRVSRAWIVRAAVDHYLAQHRVPLHRTQSGTTLPDGLTMWRRHPSHTGLERLQPVPVPCQQPV